MISWKMGAGIGVAMGLASLLAAPPVAAVTMQECSAQYKAAKSSGTLGNTTWQEFRKARCGLGAPSPAAAGSTYKPAAGAGSKAVFPLAVSPKYSASPQAGRACIPASTSTGPTRPATATAACGGCRKAAVTTASATSGSRADCLLQRLGGARVVGVAGTDARAAIPCAMDMTMALSRRLFSELNLFVRPGRPSFRPDPEDPTSAARKMSQGRRDGAARRACPLRIEHRAMLAR